MARVPQKRTSAEERVAAALRRLGMRYRRNVKSLPGSPDFANVSRGWAIQVHGCFWHQHDCRRGTMPTHNKAEWEAKFRRNRDRDSAAEMALSGLGLRVLTVWECESKDDDALLAIVAPLASEWRIG
jgi:DNA mismatch endonuclease (patch repair protein)